ncbi:MAG: ATP-binding protein [Candidatus Micrarchaeaceae archaeon]
MDATLLKRIIADQKQALEKRLERNIIDRDVPDLQRFINAPNVLAILGVRRSGKSTLASLIMKGKRFGYVNFDDERLFGMVTGELNLLLQAIYELEGDVEFLLFDEIQNVSGWELFVSRLRDTKKIVITGSNSKLLSGELSTHLTGRHIDFELFPFSFNEFLKYNGYRFEKSKSYSTSSTAAIKSALDRFVDCGGFPEVNVLGKEILPSIYTDIIQKDAILRFNIRHVAGFKELSKYLISNVSSEFTFSKLKSITSIRDIHTIKKYVDYLSSTYLIIVLDRFSFKLKEQFISPKKVYCIDHGIAKSISAALDISKSMENMVAVELLRRTKLMGNETGLFYFRNYAQNEVDFVVARGKSPEQLIQVTYASEIKGIKEREMKGLAIASNALKCNNLLIITWDYEGDIAYDGKKIRVVPLWKWLIDTSSRPK